MAGRSCSALISLSAPTIEAAAVESPHSPATSRRPRWRSSDTSFVATPLQAKPSPAPIIVIDAERRPKAESRYGVMVSAPRPTSTSVSARRWPWAVPFGGAVSAIPITLAMITATVRRSRRPACSPSIRWAANTSTTNPNASVGWTTTSGAHPSARTCKGQPRIDIAVPRSQRARLSRPHSRATRRCWSSGAALASAAWNAIPRLYRVDAAIAAAIPSTSPGMSNHDDRTPRRRPLNRCVGRLPVAPAPVGRGRR